MDVSQVLVARSQYTQHAWPICIPGSCALTHPTRATPEPRLEYTTRTSFLLLHCQCGPVLLHAIPQCHPQIGLLLRGHGFPSLLDIRQGGVGDGVRVSTAGRLPGNRYNGGAESAL